MLAGKLAHLCSDEKWFLHDEIHILIRIRQDMFSYVVNCVVAA